MKKTPVFLFVLLLGTIGNVNMAFSQGQSVPKQLYLPKKVYRIPDGNDYENRDSEFSFHRMVQTEDLAIFWSKHFGDDPSKNPDTALRFDIQAALPECQRFFTFFRDTLKFVQKGHSLTDRYKMVFYVINTDNHTAFGGGTNDTVGMLWTPAVRMNKSPYATLAHEIGHSFQYMSRADGGHGIGGGVGEMASQYMLWQVYPEWMTLENYHLKSFMEQTHYAFLHPINIYHSPYVLEYWSGKHGKDFLGKLWRETKEGEDAVMTYKRLNGMSQEAFNDEIFDAYRRFMTWDMDRIRQVASPYANQHFTKLRVMNNGDYRIDTSKCPQNYGYNGIKLRVPEAGTTLKLSFSGIAGADGFSQTKIDQAGWRYGFVAYQSDGTRVYGDVGRASTGELTFQVPTGTTYLWLVVMGAPKEHWPVAVPRRRRSADTAQEQASPAPPEQWPYEFRLTGTEVDPAMLP